MDYAGSTSHGLAGGVTSTSTVQVEYILSDSDSSVAEIGVEVPNGGFTMSGDELLGIFVQYIPDGMGSDDTINYQTASGDINPFYFYYYREGNTSSPQGYFIQILIAHQRTALTSCSRILVTVTGQVVMLGETTKLAST